MAIRNKPAGHTAGIFADMTLDGPEIGTLVAVIDRAKNLPNRKTMGKQDPYCAMRLGKEAKKTDTDRRGGQTPKWDQELRFTVHESPDYYKLKCSVFTDDKKTDLIGEAWIDLSDLIKPGGGSNDLWHQLNYKGKYAGDIRIELTYYDLRPREEKLTEKKKSRDKTSTEESSQSHSIPRQLGPRDVRRRPLPASPASGSPAVSMSVQTLPASTPAAELPARPPKIPLYQPEPAYMHSEPQTQEVAYTQDPYEDHFSVVEPPALPQPPQQHYRQPFCEDQSPTAEYDEPAWMHETSQLSDHHYASSRSSGGPSPTPLTPTSLPDEAEMWDQPDRRRSQQYTSANPVDVQYQQARPKNASTNSIPFRDSPLRHSMSQADAVHNMMEEPESYDAPPPPPMHRETTPRRQQSEYPPSSFPHYEQSVIPFAPRPQQVAPRRRSVDERSPLQQIEDDYDMYSNFPPHQHDQYERRSLPNDYPQDYPQSHPQPQQNPRMERTPERRNSHDVYYTQAYSDPRSQPQNYEGHYNFIPQEDLQQKPPGPDRSRSYDDQSFRRSEDLRERPQASGFHSHSQPDLPHTDYYKPQPVRPKPRDSHPGQVPQRKAVSPGPSPHQGGRRMSAVPFSPDAYDVLNPASSPIANDGTMFQAPGQAKEAARMKEVDKLRDQGPIIGNDGRVIDPSDHLPSDTWAPEPERKTRRPEHVIHFRSKNDHRPQSSSNASPVATRTTYHRHGHNQADARSSPLSAPSSSSRNRLQKQAPARPLPTQPYPQPQSEPQTRHMPAAEPPPHHSNKRHSYQDPSQMIHRPQLSEYQVPPSNRYAPRGVSFQDEYNSSPPQSRMQAGREYNPRHSNLYDDPLAMELSMIDIGPSRGQMVLSTRRGY